MPRFLLLLALAACTDKSPGDDTGGPDDSGDTGGETGSTTDAGITLVSVGGDTYMGPTITWTVENFEIVDDMGGEPVAGQGHVHVHVDGEYVEAVAGLSYTFPADQLPAGEHEVSVRLAGNDHEEVGPRDELTFRVLSPSVGITAPTDGTALDSAGAAVTFTYADFVLSPDIEGANVIGAGHYHLLLDGAYYDLGVDPTTAYFRHLSEGSHTLSVELANNDHTSLAPAVVASVDVTVPAGAPDVRLDDSGVGAPHDSATVPVSLQLSNFELDPDLSGTSPNRRGAGHVHVYLDGVLAAEMVTASDYLEHVSAGTHQVAVVLANVDHSELGARDWLTVEVAADRPDVTVSSPPQGERVSSDFTVIVSAEGFVFDPAAVGGTNVDGVGHWHLYLDGDYVGFSATSSAEVVGAAPGEHELTAMLVNNDHTDVVPAVFDTVRVLVE